MSNESNNGRPLNQPGLYRQKDTGIEVNLSINEDIGTPMIDAFIQAGFVKVDQSAVAPEIVATEDKYTENVTKNGVTQYRKNGVLISEEEYQNK